MGRNEFRGGQVSIARRNRKPLEFCCPLCTIVEEGTMEHILFSSCFSNSCWSRLNIKWTNNTSRTEIAIFQRDLISCPTFRNLKTLILNEWCLHEDEAALACLLGHSPILENLIFEVPKHGPEPLKTNRSYITLEQTTLEHLKTVEINCPDQISSWLFEILKVLTTFGVPLSKISIQATTWQSETYNFFCTGISSKDT